MLTIGLVAEGSHDFIMLAPLIRAELAKKTSKQVRFKMLQPTPDATGTMGDGGWARVLAWCTKYSGDQINTFYKPLFSSDDPCDAILLHIDGDALEVIAPHCAIAVPAKAISVAERVKLIVSGLEGLLAPERRDKLSFAVPVQHTEAWLIAIDKFSGDPSAVDAKAEFRRSYNHRRQKLARYYTTEVQRCTSGSWVAPSCASYVAFAQDIGQLALEPSDASEAAPSSTQKPVS